jgi:hypothetical protein
MSFELLDIDHLIIRAASLDRAVETFEALGFQIAPKRKPAAPPADDGQPARSAPFSLRHILFQPYPGRDDIANFVVLQCIEAQLDVPTGIAQVMSFMLDTEGPRAIICYSNDLDKTRAAMEEAGVEVAPSVWRVEDGWEDEESGRSLPVQSQPLITVTRRTPFPVNAFQSSTLETMRHEPWTVHPNSAKYLAGAIGVTDDVRRDVELMAGGVFGVEPEWESEDSALVRPRDLHLRIVTPRGFAALYPGLDFSSERILPALCGAVFAVESLDTLRETLDTNGVERVETPRGSVVVPRRHAVNTMVEFVEHAAA